MITFLYTLFLICVGYFVRWFQEEIRTAPIIPNEDEHDELRDKREVSRAAGFPPHGGDM